MNRAPQGTDESVLVTAFAGKLFGLDRRSGAVLWAHLLETHGHEEEVELAIDGDVVVACSKSRLTFLRYPTGQVLRQVPLVGEFARRPIMLIDQGQIFIARNGEVACYTLAGDAVWLQPFKGQGFGSVALGLPGRVRQADDIGTP